MKALAVFIGIAILLVAIPAIDVARESIAAVVDAPIATIFSVFLVLTVAGVITAIVRGLLDS